METWCPASGATCEPQHTQTGVNVNCTGWKKMKKWNQFLFVASGAHQGCTRTYVSSQRHAEATAGSTQRRSASLFFFSLFPTQRGYKKLKVMKKRTIELFTTFALPIFKIFSHQVRIQPIPAPSLWKKFFGTSSINKSYRYIRGKTLYQTVKQREWKKESRRWTTAHIIISLFFLLYLPGPTLKRVLSAIDLLHLRPWYFLSRHDNLNPSDPPSVTPSRELQIDPRINSMYVFFFFVICRTFMIGWVMIYVKLHSQSSWWLWLNLSWHCTPTRIGESEVTITQIPQLGMVRIKS